MRVSPNNIFPEVGIGEFGLLLPQISVATETLIDSYSESNRNTHAEIYSGSNTSMGQSFIGTGLKLTKSKFYLSIYYQLPATGNIVSKLYGHTGTFGTSSKPDGNLLATSNSVDISTLSLYPTFALTSFIFDGTYTLGNGTDYVICVEYSGGDVGHALSVGIDSTSPTHPGNESYFPGTVWTALNTIDVCFYIYGK
jgi:hypothetical protein